MINRIQNKRFCLHNIYLCTVYINIHTHIQYIFNIFLYNMSKYEHLNVNIFNIYCMCVYLYMHNTYAQYIHTCILCKQTYVCM